MGAGKEADRDGTTPIKLVDGEKLLRIFEKLELGLKSRSVYQVDPEFFKQYQEQGKVSARPPPLQIARRRMPG